jgi:hypothetical protein
MSFSPSLPIPPSMGVGNGHSSKLLAVTNNIQSSYLETGSKR